MRDEFSRMMSMAFAELMNGCWNRNVALVQMLDKLKAAPVTNGYKVAVSDPELRESALTVTVTIADAAEGRTEDSLTLALQTWGMYIVTDQAKGAPSLHTAYTVQPTLENWLVAQGGPRGVNFAAPLYTKDAITPEA